MEEWCRICLQMQDTHRRGFDTWVRKILWSRKWQSTPCFFLENSRDLGAWWATYSPWGCKETWLSTHTQLLMYNVMLIWCTAKWFSCTSLCVSLCVYTYIYIFFFVFFTTFIFLLLFCILTTVVYPMVLHTVPVVGFGQGIACPVKEWAENVTFWQNGLQFWPFGATGPSQDKLGGRWRTRRGVSVAAAGGRLLDLTGRKLLSQSFLCASVSLSVKTGQAEAEYRCPF